MKKEPEWSREEYERLEAYGLRWGPTSDPYSASGASIDAREALRLIDAQVASARSASETIHDAAERARSHLAPGGAWYDCGEQYLRERFKDFLRIIADQPLNHEHKPEYPSRCTGCEHLAADLVSRMPVGLRLTQSDFDRFRHDG